MPGTARLIEAGVGMVLFVYVAAALIPGAMNAIVNVNSTTNPNWGTSNLALWGIVGIFVIIAVIFMVYAFAKKEMGR